MKNLSIFIALKRQDLMSDKNSTHHCIINTFSCSVQNLKTTFILL